MSNKKKKKDSLYDVLNDIHNAFHTLDVEFNVNYEVEHEENVITLTNVDSNKKYKLVITEY